MERWDQLYTGGYRFCFGDGAFKPSTDTFLLGGFAQVRRGERVCDLGAGIGLPGLMLLSREPEVHITDIDIDEAACALARRSAEANGLTERIRIIQADLRRREQLPTGGSFDVCVANPPYFPPHTGRVAKGSRGVQRAELQCTMDELCAAAAYLLRSGGRLYPKELRFVQKDSRTPPRLVLLGCRRDGGTGLTVRTPLLLQNEHGGESQELRRIYFRDRG